MSLPVPNEAPSPTDATAPAPRPPGGGRGGPVVPGERLYRERAVAAFLRGDEDSSPLDVAPLWTVRVVRFAVALVAVVIAILVFARVEVTSRGRGMLRVEGGAQVLAVQTAGRVAEVLARSGDAVRAGDPIVTLDSAPVKSALLEADRRLELAKASAARFEAQRRPFFEATIRGLQAEVALLEKRSASQAESVEGLRAKLRTYGALEAQGLASGLSRRDVAEEVAQATRQKMSVDETLAQTRLKIASSASDLESERWKLRTELEDAQSKRDAVAFALAQTSIAAPRAGKLEAVLVHAGDALDVGAPVGKLVPMDAPLQIVAFVPERDRAFLEIGSEARVEIDELPASEFGMLAAHVTRIAADIASDAETREALGERSLVGEPAYRVELSLDDDATARRLARYVRPGSLVTVRCALRRHRLVTLLLTPLRRWLE